MDKKIADHDVLQLTKLLIEKISDDIEMVIEYNTDDLKTIAFKMIDAYNKGMIDLTKRSEIINLISLIEKNYAQSINFDHNFKIIGFRSSQKSQMIALLPIIHKVIELMNFKVTQNKLTKSFKDDYYPTIFDQWGGHLYNKQHGIIYLVR